MKQETQRDYNGYLECNPIGVHSVMLNEDEFGTMENFSYKNGLKLQELSAEDVQVKINYSKQDEMCFDLIGVDASFSNALRRIMLCEVPTMAIETVQMWQNTGVMHDEILAHRLGLIVFNVDPDIFSYRSEDAPLNEHNSVRFKLHIKYDESKIPKDSKYLNVYAKDFKWDPYSDNERNKFSSNPPKVVHDDILITKLGMNQELEIIAYLEKGIGRTHAKWSPVCTASYRLEPEILLPTNPELDIEESDELVRICPMKVFELERKRVIVKRPRDCTTCRACVERFNGKVKVLKKRWHFIFTIESTGSIAPSKIFRTAVSILMDKCTNISNTVVDY